TCKSRTKINCPSIPIPLETQQKYIVQLTSQDVKEPHFKMLEYCYGKTVVNNSYPPSDDPNIVRDDSFGTFICYIGWFGSNDADALSKRSDVKSVESDSASSTADKL
ncbi:14853_t:CDS:1, partial [Dentiscutata heterogama]